MADVTAIQGICALLERGQIDRVEFSRRFAQQVAADVGCARAGFRLLIQTPNGQALRNAAMYDVERQCMVKVPDMDGAAVSTYLEALMRNGCVVADEARIHPTTAGLLSGYLQPANVHSILDVALAVNGVLHGALCCEYLGTPGHSTAQQLNLLRQIAFRATLTLTRAITSQVDTSPAALWEPARRHHLMTVPMPLNGDDGGG